MLGPASFVLAILGCGEGEANCQPVAMQQTRYESRAACLAATESALAEAEAPYPVIVADCRAAGARASEMRANDVRVPEPRGWATRTRSASLRR